MRLGLPTVASLLCPIRKSGAGVVEFVGAMLKAVDVTAVPGFAFTQRSDEYAAKLNGDAAKVHRRPQPLVLRFQRAEWGAGGAGAGLGHGCLGKSSMDITHTPIGKPHCPGCVMYFTRTATLRPV